MGADGAKTAVLVVGWFSTGMVFHGRVNKLDDGLMML